MPIRQFKSGAKRDTNEGKLEYARFLSPIVIRRYAEYMNKHRKMTDGTLREPDDWQQLFGENHEQICMDSLARHFMDIWLENDGYKSRDGKEEALCAIMFNSMAMLYKLLKVDSKE
jgi:hypothetical protein